jgi:hypothetical protein
MVRFLTTKEGGRQVAPDLSDYRPTALFNNAHHSCRVSDGTDYYELGDWSEGIITMIGTQLPPENFELYEGHRKVADALCMLTLPKSTPVAYPYPEYLTQDNVVYRKVRTMKVKQPGDMIMGNASGILHPPLIPTGDVSNTDTLYRPVGLGAQF